MASFAPKGQTVVLSEEEVSALASLLFVVRTDSWENIPKIRVAPNERELLLQIGADLFMQGDS